MKITDVKVDILKVELDEPYAAGGRSVEANWHVLARITTDEGIEGFGYDVKQRADLVRAIAAATEELGQHIIGMDIMNPEAVWNHLAARGDWVGPGGFLHWAIAPLDIAVWDAAGKLIGQPIYKMLGGYRDGIPAYASDRLWYSLSLDELSESAENHAKNGFGGLKLRLGTTAPPEEQV
jgi:L-alanine-DL-glutamate epimerase-like enolase superfamily enzyme